MIDFHSHVLPKMDDGSRSSEESMKLLRESKKQGVDTIVATPHFYAEQNDPETFLKRRRGSYERIKPMLNEEHPEIVLGAEVQYFPGITQTEELPELAIGDTNILLLEMPFMHWDKRVVEDVLELERRGDVKILLAHIELFNVYWYFNRKEIERLHEAGVLFQSNADFFVNKDTKRKALRLMKKGYIDVLGSDCHSVDRRPPRLKFARDIIKEELGEEYLRRIDDCSKKLLQS